MSGWWIALLPLGGVAFKWLLDLLDRRTESSKVERGHVGRALLEFVALRHWVRSRRLVREQLRQKEGLGNQEVAQTLAVMEQTSPSTRPPDASRLEDAVRSLAAFDPCLAQGMLAAPKLAAMYRVMEAGDLADPAGGDPRTTAAEVRFLPKLDESILLLARRHGRATLRRFRVLLASEQDRVRAAQEAVAALVEAREDQRRGTA